MRINLRYFAEYLITQAANELETFYFEDRAAHLASCQLPLIVALAGKNNVLSCSSKNTVKYVHILIYIRDDWSQS